MAVLLIAAAIAFPRPALARTAASAGEHRPPLQKSASFGAYQANTYFDPGSNTNDARFEILKQGRPIYRLRARDNGARFVIGKLYDDDPDARLVTMGADITGDGQPDLVVSEWSGGANCCLTLHIFEIGRRLRKIGAIDAAYGDTGPHFVKLKDPGLQVQVYDWTFANWHSDFASSPAPRVILSYQRGAYRIAPDLMSTAAPDMKDVAAKIGQIRDATKSLRAGSWPGADIPPLLWGTMLDLIYSGHRLLAWQVVDMAWPKQIGGKETFVDDFIAQMKKSPYWKTVAALGS